MLTYNRPQMIGRAIASVRKQSFGDWELIIVQDGENRETERLLSDWLAREPRIRYFRRGTVGSIAEASNFGLAAATGDYIAILDDDDCWCDPEKLERQVEFLDGNPDHVGCGGGYVVVDPQDQPRGKYLKPEKDADVRARALLANPLANSTAIFRRVVGGEAVVYDPAMKQFADWDFWLTMGAKGKLYNFPVLMANYALWDGGSSFKAQRANARAALRIVRKHRGQYRGYMPALMLAGLYFGYTYLPLGVRRLSYASLSALKKAMASEGGRLRQA